MEKPEWRLSLGLGGVTGEEHEGTFWGVGNGLYFHLDGGSFGCVISKNCIKLFA